MCFYQAREITPRQCRNQNTLKMRFISESAGYEERIATVNYISPSRFTSFARVQSGS